MIENRTRGVRQLLDRLGLTGFLFTSLPNIRYLCGFTGTDGALVVTPQEAVFLTDSRYTVQARFQVSVGEVREYTRKLEGVIDCLRGCGASRVGFEADTLAFATVERLKEKGGAAVEWVPVSAELQGLRAAKDADELSAIEEAARLNAEAFEEIVPMMRPGAVEREVALALEYALKRRGGEEKAFDFIVASGLRGAMPHGVASERVIQKGELVTIDFGTRVKGYHSDDTVTVAIGDVPPRLREIYALVLSAHDRALEQVRPGLPLKELDGVARRHINECGYGDFFGHGLGHGVGLEIHESPTVSSRSEEIAAEGMVITIEPGIYVPDLGGVRIEDMVLVPASGHRRLTRIPKDFRRLPG